MSSTHARRRDRPMAPITLHECRHTFASLLVVGLKLDPVSVSRQLGHRNVTITLNTYAHLFEQAKAADEMRDRLDASFGHLLASEGTFGR